MNDVPYILFCLGNMRRKRRGCARIAKKRS